MEEGVAAWLGDQDVEMEQAVGSWAVGRGGVHQQLAHATLAGLPEPAGQKQGKSALAALLCERHALGLLPATLLQEICAAAIADGLDHGEVRELASIGAWGDHPSSCTRDLFNQHKLSLNRIADPLVVDLPMYNIHAKPPQVAPRSQQGLALFPSPQPQVIPERHPATPVGIPLEPLDM